MSKKYHLTIRSDPLNPQTKTVTLDNEQLKGVCMIAEALYGDRAQEVLQVQDASLRNVNCSSLLDNDIIAEGEEVFEYEGGTEISAHKTKKHSAVVNGHYGNYLVQFNSDHFLQGMEIGCSLFTKDCRSIEEFVQPID